jgi:hypothetical protein
MLKTLAVLAVLAVIAPRLAVADGNQPNTPPTLPGPFAGDPPYNTFNGNGPPSMPPGLGGSFPPGCAVLAHDKDDNNHGPNGDDTNGKATSGNPNCQPPASP